MVADATKFKPKSFPSCSQKKHTKHKHDAGCNEKSGHRSEKTQVEKGRQVPKNDSVNPVPDLAPEPTRLVAVRGLSPQKLYAGPTVPRKSNDLPAQHG